MLAAPSGGRTNRHGPKPPIESTNARRATKPAQKAPFFTRTTNPARRPATPARGKKAHHFNDITAVPSSLRRSSTTETASARINLANLLDISGAKASSGRDQPEPFRQRRPADFQTPSRCAAMKTGAFQASTTIGSNAITTKVCLLMYEKASRGRHLPDGKDGKACGTS